MTSSNVPTGLAAAAQVGGGTFAAGPYFWKITYTDGNGETAGSAEATAVIALNGSCNLSWNAPPPGVTGVKVYRGTVTNTENVLVATLGAVAAYVDTGTAGVAGVPPVLNSSAIGAVVVINAPATLYGWSIRETTGIAPVTVDFLDGGQVLGSEFSPAGSATSQWFGDMGVNVSGGIRVRAVNGLVSGVCYVGFDR